MGVSPANESRRSSDSGALGPEELPGPEDLAVAVASERDELILQNALEALEKHYTGSAEAPETAEEHDCLAHLEHRQHEWVETHGLDCGPYERCWEEWWECTLCGEEFTARELDKEMERSTDGANDAA